MIQLKIRCFQSLTITLNEQPVPFRSNKGRALLLYLAVEQERAHQRSMLAGLLWPDVPEARARQNLSQTLLEVRKAIGDQTAQPPFLQITAQTIAFNRRCNHWVDTVAFAQAIATAEHAKAAHVYCGAFLEDFVLPDSDLWEEWVATVRERYRQQALDLFLKLSDQQAQAGQLEEAMATTRNLLTLAPWQEEAHRQLMWLLALAGQRSAALAQYDTLTQMLMDEWGVAPATETDDLYDRIVAGDVVARNVVPRNLVPHVPAVSTAANSVVLQPDKRVAPFQAQALPAHFVGRVQEINRLCTELAAPGLQIRAIVGMGGVGKTALAAQIAHARRSDFHDGVLWGNPLTSNALDILASWATAYGYDFGQINDLGSRAAAVRGMLAERHTLLIIDNVQQVSDMEPLLPSGGNCAVLFTTRDLEVATALNAEVLLLDELEQHDALELLRKILGAQRVDQEYAAAVELCTRCGDLPLAVEIAAQRLKSRPRMKLAQMVARLGDVIHRLDLGISDRAVRTSFEVSWDALDEEMQGIFALLAVFAGRSFQVDMVANLAAVDRFDVEDVLFTLEALSLVRSEAGERANVRYRQHPLLADFARIKLTDSERVFARFSDCCYAFVRDNAAHFDLLEPEWENVMAAMQIAYQQERWPLVLAYSDLLTQPWQTRARYSDARCGYAWAQIAAEQLHDQEALATILLRWGEACMEQNEYDEAETLLHKSLQHAYELEEDRCVADAQFGLGLIAAERSQFADAEALLLRSLAVRQLLNDRPGIARIHFQLGVMKYEMDDVAAAEALLRQALHEQEEVSDLVALIPTLRELAQVTARKASFAEAGAYSKRALDLSEQLHDQGESAATLYTMTILERRQGNFQQAQRYAEEALALMQRLGLSRLEGMVLYQLSMVLKELSAYDQAVQHTLASIAIADRVQNKIGKLFALVLLGDLYMLQQRPEAGRESWQAGMALAQQLDHQSVQQQLSARIGN